MLYIKALILAIIINNRLSAAALNKVLKFLGDCLFNCGAYFKNC